MFASAHTPPPLNVPDPLVNDQAIGTPVCGGMFALVGTSATTTLQVVGELTVTVPGIQPTETVTGSWVAEMP